jgi:hypothetical protein
VQRRVALWYEYMSNSVSTIDIESDARGIDLDDAEVTAT